jgi:hypothetical protein
MRRHRRRRRGPAAARACGSGMQAGQRRSSCTPSRASALRCAASQHLGVAGGALCRGWRRQGLRRTGAAVVEVRRQEVERHAQMAATRHLGTRAEGAARAAQLLMCTCASSRLLPYHSIPAAGAPRAHGDTSHCRHMSALAAHRARLASAAAAAAELQAAEAGGSGSSAAAATSALTAESSASAQPGTSPRKRRKQALATGAAAASSSASALPNAASSAPAWPDERAGPGVSEAALTWQPLASGARRNWAPVEGGSDIDVGLHADEVR